jgi:hypothetical protein
VGTRESATTLPFDATEVLENFRNERYISEKTVNGGIRQKIERSAYYFVRPVLPIHVRKHLQRVRLDGWKNIKFPSWSVDDTVGHICADLMALCVKANNGKPVPFVWFWPEGYPSCAIMTHDIEAEKGRDFCKQLMDLDDSFGVKSSFQVVPELRYEVPGEFLDAFRRKGFEVNVHDLNHDGRLFDDEEEFLLRSVHINRYAKEFGAKGFRAGAMYRNQEWFHAFDFSYDMSVPSVAHLEPQRGGCCTVMPYFIGKILELPLTAAQDYSLFHVLGDFSIELWKKQIELVCERNGLVSFNAHPDYLIEPRARNVYRDLLAHLASLRDARKLWIPLPGEVDRWWRNRSQLRLVREGKAWRVEGLDKERARVAYARLDGDHLVYTLGGAP